MTDKELKRFLAKINITDDDTECWEWNAALSHGYGVFGTGSERQAHRIMWTQLHGEIGEGMVVMHSCDNPKCCNPSHLSLGTHADNMRDMSIKNRGTTKLTTEDILEIRRLGAEGHRPAYAAKLYNISPDAVAHIVARRTHKHI